MTSDTHDTDGRRNLALVGDRRAIASIRLAIGLVQGLGLWWLFQAQDGVKSWPATEPLIFWPLLLLFAYLPIVLLAGVGRLRLRSLVIWAIIAGSSLILLAWHDIARQSLELDDREFTPALLAFSAAALFIAHHLIVPADRERRLIAAFPTYFDATWLAGVQLALSIGFAGVFWLLLFLGAALFNIIGLDFLRDLIRQPFFSIPVTTLTFAVAVQLTDIRDGLIRGVRTVALMLLSWLLLVMTVLVAGFLIALPFTGLNGLWQTGSATSLVLSAAAALIILINTAYQDGRADNLPPVVLRVAVRVASVLLSPLILIALWGLALRIGQHGLTPDRIIATACALIGIAYAIGYGFAALIPFVRPSDWMKPLERTNITTAVLEVAIILALFSPLADPARLSVADQVARLERGAVTPQTFDYAFLRFDSGHAGTTALAELARSSDPEIAQQAKQAQLADSPYSDLLRPKIIAQIESWPKGTTLPIGFVAAIESGDLMRSCEFVGDCVATLRDLNNDGTPEVLFANRSNISLFATDSGGRWVEAGTYAVTGCIGQQSGDPRALLRSNELQARNTAWPDLEVGGRFTSPLDPSDPCRKDHPPVNP